MNKQQYPISTKRTPGAPHKSDTMHQAGSLPASYLEARVLNLEEKQVSLQEDVGALKELCHGIATTVDKLDKSGWPVHTGPSQGMDGIKASLQSARQFGMEFERLMEGTHGPVNCDSGSTAKDPTADLDENESESESRIMNEYVFNFHDII